MTSPTGRGLRALIPAAQARTAGDTTMLLPNVAPAAPASVPTSTPISESAPALEDQAVEDQVVVDRAVEGRAGGAAAVAAASCELLGVVQLDRSIIASAAAVLADVAAGGSTRDVRYLAGALADLFHQAATGPTRTTTAPPGSEGC